MICVSRASVSGIRPSSDACRLETLIATLGIPAIPKARVFSTPLA